MKEDEVQGDVRIVNRKSDVEVDSESIGCLVGFGSTGSEK
jgi:hypothetical protein